MTEILFLVDEAAEGGYTARAVGASIFTEADTLEQLREAVREAVRCHFEESDRPPAIRLHLVHDEVIAAWDVRLPRDLSGRELARALRRYGYAVTRETGSHMRLTTQQGGVHHVTIPDHPNLRVGTLAGILSDVAAHLQSERDALAASLFERWPTLHRCLARALWAPQHSPSVRRRGRRRSGARPKTRVWAFFPKVWRIAKEGRR
jgi:predicted RNA binding protein YcfA (HicA-like mRNA interferase family)